MLQLAVSAEEEVVAMLLRRQRCARAGADFGYERCGSRSHGLFALRVQLLGCDSAVASAISV